MSYQVLARKWRPSNFDEMVGQAHVLRALTSALDNERLHHAYLFTGTRGVGKTTISRILARCLNCDTGISSKPCGTCSACNEISEGRFVDLIEVDAASRSKVDETRELLANVQYRPTRGRYKVYLIDEVHMLSTHSFNALLKTLEEPPPHVVFLLATTDPQKLPATVLSRCLQFHLKNMQPDDIQKHLAHILTTDEIVYEDNAIESLSWSAKGSMRDALSLLDQAIAFGDGKVIDKDVREMLGTIDRNQVYELLTAIAANDGEACMEIIEDLSQFAPDYEDVLGELLAVLHRVALLQQIPNVTLATQDQKQIQTISTSISPEDVQLFYQLALHGRRDLPLAPDMRSGFEMCVLRLMNFRPKKVSGVTPVKKSESSELNGVKTNEVSSQSHEPTEIAMPNLSISDKNDDEEDYFDPRDSEELPVVAAKQKVANVAEDIEPRTKSPSWPLKSPLLRNQQPSPETETVSNDEPGQSVTEETLSESVIEPAIETKTDSGLNDTKDEVTSQDIIQPSALIDDELNNPSAENTSEFLDDEQLPLPVNLNHQNWHLLIENLKLLGVTEQIALNSQYVSYENNKLSFSLANTMRSMLSNEHLNKMTAAINALYNDDNNKADISLAVNNFEPEHETPRQRRDRIREARHQLACDNLYNDQQVQGILKAFSATIDHETVETVETVDVIVP